MRVGPPSSESGLRAKSTIIQVQPAFDLSPWRRRRQLSLTDQWAAGTKGPVNQVHCPGFNGKHRQGLGGDFG